MKLIGWLLDFDTRYRRVWRRYKRCGTFKKVITLLFIIASTFIPAICLLLLKSKDVFVVVLSAIFGLAFLIGNIENGIFHAICGFKSFRGKTNDDDDFDDEDGSGLDLAVGIISILSIVITVLSLLLVLSF